MCHTERVRKIYWLVILGVVLAGIVVAGGVYWQKNYPIATDYTQPTQYPFVSWNEIRWGSVARSLRRQEANGALGTYTEQVAPVTKFVKMPPKLVDERGVDYVEIGSEIVRSNLYSDEDKRPFSLAGYYQTSIDGEPYYLIYQKWHSLDGTVSFVPYIFPSEIVLEGGQLTDYYRRVVSEEMGHMMSPVLYWQSQEHCVRNMAGSSNYCEWYFKNKQRYTDLLTKWVDEGVVPREIERWPAAVRLTPIFVEQNNAE